MSRVQIARQREGRERPVRVEDWDMGLIDRLRDDFASFMQMDLAESSLKTYASHVSQYTALCAHLEVPATPSPEVLARFIVGRACNHYKISTIEAGVAAVSRWAAEHGEEGLSSHPLVRRALRIASKVAVPAGAQKLPLDREDLASLVRYLGPRRDFIGHRDAAMMLIGWAGMFRSEELADMEWRDLHFSLSSNTLRGVKIYVPSSKTDQAQEGAWVFVAACEEEKALCPVQALLRLRKWSQHGAVFTGRPGSSAISKTTIGVRLKKGLQQIGVADWDLYAAHSLRRGGATYAAQQGVSMRYIQMMGRWKSDVVREYLYAAPDELWQAAKTLQQGR